jgi:hypothetical protein
MVIWVVKVSHHPRRSVLCTRPSARTASKSLPIKFLADPHQLTPIESNSYKNHREEGTLPHFNPQTCPRFLTYLFSFHTLPNSFALAKNSTRFFSSNSELFRKNTRGWGTPPVRLSFLHSLFRAKSGFANPLFSIPCALRIGPRMRILSDQRESKNSSLAALFARSFHSLHKECFTTLLQSKGFALFPKTAGWVSTLPISERVHPERSWLFALRMPLRSRGATRLP